MISILRNKATHRVLDSNGRKHVYTHEHNSGDYQKWTFTGQDDGSYILQNIATFYMLHSSNESVYTHIPNGTPHEKWKFYRLNDGSYVIQNIATSRVLDTAGVGTAASIDSNVPDNQKWFLEATGVDPHNDMIAFLKNKATHKMLDSNKDTHVYTLEYNGGDYQMWLFRRQHDGTYVLKNVETSFVLHSDNERLHTSNLHGNSHQKWKFHRQKDGSYVIQNIATSRVLDSDGIGKADSIDSNVRDNQKWFLEPTGVDPHNGMIVFLKNKATQRVLNSNDSTDVYTLEHNGSNYQKWLFRRQDDETYVLQNVETLFILHCNNERLHTSDFNGNSHQKWKFYRLNDGSYVIQNIATSRVLDSNGVGKADSIDSNVRDNQKWFLEGK